MKKEVNKVLKVLVKYRMWKGYIISWNRKIKDKYSRGYMVRIC